LPQLLPPLLVLLRQRLPPWHMPTAAVGAVGSVRGDADAEGSSERDAVGVVLVVLVEVAIDGAVQVEVWLAVLVGALGTFDDSRGTFASRGVASVLVVGAPVHPTMLSPVLGYVILGAVIAPALVLVAIWPPRSAMGRTSPVAPPAGTNLARLTGVSSL